MTFADFFLSLDRTLFLFINQLPHNPFLDLLGKLLSAGSGFIWFFLLAILILLQDRKAGRRTMLGLILASLVSQILVVGIFKPFIARPRPDLIEPATISVPSRIDSLVPFIFFDYDYAFPSGHTTIAFAGAYILSKKCARIGKNKRPAFVKWRSNGLYLLATLVSFSRIYLGKHYPSDVLAGAGLGLAVGWFSVKMISWFCGKLVI